jgi:hypothetical protein
MSSNAAKLAQAAADTLTRKKAPQVAPIIQDKRPRLSVDIDREDYTRLVSFCQEIALAVGRTRVQHVWVIRALVKELWEDKELMKRVIERVREENPLNPK